MKANRFKRMGFLLAMLLLIFVTALAITASAADAVEYVERSFEEGQLTATTRTVLEYTEVSADTTSMTEGYYVVSGTVTVSEPITVSGAVHLILRDGSTLIAPGIQVSTGNSFAIYGQSSDPDKMGKLISTSDTQGLAGIGGFKGANGEIVIHGGYITAQGHQTFSAGIGGGSHSQYMAKYTCGAVTVNGGIVYAKGGRQAAGIGGGFQGHGSNVTVNGGSVTALSGTNASGIGGGREAMGGTYVQNGGTVIAVVSKTDLSPTAAAIGNGSAGGAAGTVTHNGGTLLRHTKNDGDVISVAGVRFELPITIPEGFTMKVADGQTVNFTGGAFVLNPAQLLVENGATVLVDGEAHTEHSITRYVDVGDGTHKEICANCSATVATEIHNATQEYVYTASENQLTATCTICDATATLTISAPEELLYNAGEKHATVSGSIIGVETPEITYKRGDDPLVGAPVNAGGYVAGITLGGVSASIDFEIERQTTTAEQIGGLPPSAVVYDATGKAVSLSAKSGVVGFGAISSVKYYKDDGVTPAVGDDPELAPINVGSYIVKVDVSEGENYTAAEGLAIGAIVIVKASAPTISFPTAERGVYGDTLADIALNGGSTEYGSFAWADGTLLPPVVNGGYTVVFTPSESTLQNYEAITTTEQVVLLTVAPKPVIVSAQSQTICVDGAYALTYTVSGFVGDDTFTIPPSLTTDANVQAAGRYVITVSDAFAEENYSIVYMNALLTVNEHVYGAWEKQDAEQHQRACACGHVDRAEHSWGEGEIAKHPTCVEKGEETLSCTGCKEAATRELPADGSAHVNADKNRSCDLCNAELPRDGLSGGAVAGIVIGAVAVAGLGGFALLWFVIKKKTWRELVRVFKK